MWSIRNVWCGKYSYCFSFPKSCYCFFVIQFRNIFHFIFKVSHSSFPNYSCFLITSKLISQLSINAQCKMEPWSTCGMTGDPQPPILPSRTCYSMFELHSRCKCVIISLQCFQQHCENLSIDHTFYVVLRRSLLPQAASGILFHVTCSL